MLSNYLKIAFKVLLRRKFFTLISLFGVSFTLLVLTTATGVLDHVLGPMPPETRLDRTLGFYFVRMAGPKATRTGFPGYGLLDGYARGLPGVERESFFSAPNTVDSYPNGTRVRLFLKRTDAEFWRILEFRFLEGGPYTSDDVARGSLVAVINETTRRRFFGHGSAVGRTIEADDQRFRVIGVVPDVSLLRIVPFADLWVPLTTAKTDGYKTGLMGDLMGLLLVRSQADFPAIREEFRSRLGRVPLTEKDFDKIIAAPETFLEGASRKIFGRRQEEDSHPERFWGVVLGAALLFMLLPAVNLVNLSVSRIMERASEIGVRKAFGASSRTLVGQFVVENVLLTLIGGLVGFVLSELVLRGLSQSGLIPYAQFHLNLRVFLYGLALALFFGLLSGVYPAWRMSRLHPVEALRGGAR